MQQGPKSFFKFVIFLGIIAVILKFLVFEIAVVGGYSMIPNLVRGDAVLVNTRASLDLGDVAVCKDPTDATRLVVARVMALEGSTIAINRSDVVIDGDRLVTETSEAMSYVDQSTVEDFEFDLSVSPEDFVGRTHLVAVRKGSKGRSKRFRGGEMRGRTVEGGAFLLGDNRNMAYDSRHFGTVDLDECIGKAVLVLWASEDSGDFLAADRRFQLVR